MAAGAVAVAGLGLGLHVIAGTPSPGRTQRGPVPAGPVAVAYTFTAALLATEAGHEGALAVLEHTATPELVRAVAHALAGREGPGNVEAGAVTEADVLEAAPDEVVVLVQARVRPPGAAPLAVAWALEVRRAGTSWTVAGVAERWHAPVGW